MELLEDHVVNVSHVRKLAITRGNTKTFHQIIVPITSATSFNSEELLKKILIKFKGLIDDSNYEILESKSYEYIDNELIEI